MSSCISAKIRIVFRVDIRRLFLPFVLSGLVSLPVEGKEEYVEGEVLVTFRSDVAASAARRNLASRSLELTEHFDKLAVGRGRVLGLVRKRSRTTAALIEELGKDPSVEIVEPNYIRRVSFLTPDDPHFTKLWGLKNTGQTVNGTAGSAGVDVKFMEAWNLSRTSSASPPVVGVIDTGVDITHPDLAPNIWTNPGEIAGNGIDDDGNGYVDDVKGYDFSLGIATVTDSGEHGTHVAGTIAAAGKNGTGIIGLQFHAKIIPMKVSTDGNTMSASAAIAACNYAIALKQKGVNIVALNASYGGAGFSTTERNAIIALRDAGIVFCAAAGNDGMDNDAAVNYPSGYDVSNIIAVASHTSAGSLSSFSNYGATTVDIAAPGSGIYSTMPVSMTKTSTLAVGGISYPCQEIEFSGITDGAGITRTIHPCGQGLAAADFPAAVNGNIALIQRGTNPFSEKVTRAKTAGAVAVIIYDNTTGQLITPGWTLGAAGSWLPAVQVTQATGNAILAALPVSGTVVNGQDPSVAYQFLSGTSMACPHVAAAVAFAAWNFPSETMVQRIDRILTRVTTGAAFTGKVKSGGRLDLLKIIDTDDDGLPDWWEQEQFGTLARTGPEDTDGDGFGNLAEFLAGTSPVSGASRLSFLSAVEVANGSGSDFVLRFPTVAERRYRVEWSNDLQTPWTMLGSVFAGTGSIMQLVDPGAPQQVQRRFYRLVLID